MTSSIQTHKDLTNIGSGTIAAPTGKHDFQNGQRFYNRDDAPSPPLIIPDWRSNTFVQSVAYTSHYPHDGKGLTLAGDGSRLLVGERAAFQAGHGKISLFNNNGSDQFSYIGRVIEIDADSPSCNTDMSVIVAFNGTSSDRVRVYSRSGNSLTQRAWFNVGDLYGPFLTSCTADGTSFVVGDITVLHVYNYDPITYALTLIQSLSIPYTRYGNPVKMSGNGLSILVSEKEYDGKKGRVQWLTRPDVDSPFVFYRYITPWPDENIANKYFGNHGLALDDSGNKAAIGSETSIYTFDKTAPSDGELRVNITEVDATTSGVAGGEGIRDCAFNSDGTLLAVAVSYPTVNGSGKYLSWFMLETGHSGSPANVISNVRLENTLNRSSQGIGMTDDGKVVVTSCRNETRLQTFRVNQ